MKHKLLNSIKIISIAGILAVGISYYAYAFTGPTSAIFAPMHTGDTNQVKQGGIFANVFAAKNLTSYSNTGIPAGVILAKNLVKSFDGWFNSQAYIDGALRIGNGWNIAATDIPPGSVLPLSADTTPLTIDLMGRAPSDATGKNSMELLSGNSCLAVATTVVNTAAIQFWDTTGQRNADIIANQVRLTGGSPAAGSVLTSDANGNATWSTIRAVGGQIQVTNNAVSPVVAGQSC